MSVFIVFSLFFPLALFSSGALLLYRTYSNQKDIPSGKISSKESFESLISGERCVYCKVLVEYFEGGHQPWKEVFTYSKSSRFKAGDKDISSTEAEQALYELSKFNEFRGRAGEAFRGLVGNFVDNMKTAAATNIALTVMDSVGLRSKEDFASDKERVPDYVIGKALELPGGAALRAHLGRQLRVREYLIPEGAKASVLKEGGIFSSHYLISDESEEKVRLSARERSLFRLGIGAGLIVLSLILSVLILLS